MRLLKVLIGCCILAAPTLGVAQPAGGRAMVDAANPLAVEAGLKVLRAGGSAVDAAVAVQATLGLVEPQSSGLGGGAFLTYYDAKTHAVTAYDGREMAPAAATPSLFLKPDGKPMAFQNAVLSGKSAGVPGAMAMLYSAQKAHGRLRWRALFGEGERLASDGFTVSPRLAGMIAGKFGPSLGAGRGALLHQPRRIADEGRRPAGEPGLRGDASAARLGGPVGAARGFDRRRHRSPSRRRPGSRGHDAGGSRRLQAGRGARALPTLSPLDRVRAERAVGRRGHSRGARPVGSHRHR